MSEGINITSAQLKQWETDKARLERDITAKQQELATVKQRLAAARILTGPGIKTVNGTIVPVTGIDTSRGMSHAIEQIAVNSPAPVPKNELKTQLETLGFPKTQLRAYVYTAIMRLKNAGRVSVLPDGRIWKASE